MRPDHRRASFTFPRREAIVSALTISAPQSCRERRERPIVGRHKLLMRLRRDREPPPTENTTGMLWIHQERSSLKSYRAGRERSRIPRS